MRDIKQFKNDISSIGSINSQNKRTDAILLGILEAIYDMHSDLVLYMEDKKNPTVKVKKAIKGKIEDVKIVTEKIKETIEKDKET